MKTIEQIKEKIQYAYSVQNGSTAIMREFLDSVREVKSQIRDDRNLSSIGQDDRIAKLQGHWERKALEQAAEIKSLYQKTLAEAKIAAEKIMLADVPSVDDRSRKVFQMKADELQSKIHFATNAIAAVESLEELVNAADQPALAAEIKGQFMQLSQQAVSLAGDQNEALSMRKTLGQLYDRLQSNAFTEEGRAASEIVQQADAMRDAQIFNPLVANALREISPLVPRYVNDPQAYFDRNGGGE